MKTFDDYQQFQIPLNHSKSSKPDRVHIGLVLLSTEHSLDYEWSKLLGNQAMTFSTRILFNGNMTADCLKEISKDISVASELIATDLPMDVMAFSCTSASMVIGEEEISRLLTLHRGDIPATNPWTAAKAAFKCLGAKRIAVISPYPSGVNYVLYQQLVNEGFEVSAIGAMEILKDTDITKVSKESLHHALEEVLPGTHSDAVFMSCTNLRAIDYIQAFEDRYKIPVITSNSALFWHAMQLAGRKVVCEGYGSLLGGNYNVPS